MKKGYYRIEGEFHISEDGFFIDETRLEDDTIIHLPIKILKKIITDAKRGVI